MIKRTLTLLIILIATIGATDEILLISKRVIPLVEFVKKAIDEYSGIDLEEARFFSRNSQIHPLISKLLQDPLYSIVFFAKIHDGIYENLSNKNFTSIFYTVARLSADVKRIELLQNPAEKFLPQTYEKTEYPEVLSLISSFSLCMQNSVEQIKKLVENNQKFSVDHPKNLTESSEIITRKKLTQKDIEYFLESLNTSYYLLLFCVDKLIKKKDTFYKVKSPINIEIHGVNIEIYPDSNEFIVISETPTLVISTGGEKTFFFKKWSKEVFPTATVILSLGDNRNTYIFKDAAPLSLRFIYDEGGDDNYICDIGCFGGSFFSADMLVDEKGNDSYKAVGLSQGGAIIGTGILIDLSGDDRYESTAFSQGFGGLGGGALIDLNGNDQYILKKGKDFPSFQDREHNLSMGQGCGTGFRADYIPDFQSIPGGFGILLDFSGNDLYSAEVFSQGCGYWYGVGVLGDQEGNDKYEGYWYCQGSSAHFGAGIFYNFSGNDSYTCKFQGQGHGHDFGIGVFLDYGTDDSDNFSCDTRCLGSAHANGSSIFINQGGSDTYEAERIAFGDSIVDLYERKEHSIRQVMLTKGLFIDIGGEDDKFFLAGERVSKENISSKFYSKDEMKKYIEEKYTIRRFHKF